MTKCENLKHYWVSVWGIPLENVLKLSFIEIEFGGIFDFILLKF